jgi:hypothetical protein
MVISTTRLDIKRACRPLVCPLIAGVSAWFSKHGTGFQFFNAGSRTFATLGDFRNSRASASN